jgi:hypothetical protein
VGSGLPHFEHALLATVTRNSYPNSGRATTGSAIGPIRAP